MRPGHVITGVFCAVLLASQLDGLAKHLSLSKSHLHRKSSSGNKSLRSNGREKVVEVLEPIEVLHEYISWHSNETLGDHILQADRKYIIAQYNCPHQAGNVMTRFLNLFLLAVATNRTLLVTYENSWGKKGSNPGSAKDCHKIMHPAGWVPQINSSQVNESDVFIFKQKNPLRRACKKVANGTDCREFLKKFPSRAKDVALRAHGVISDHQLIKMKLLSGCMQSYIHGYVGRFNLSDPTCYNYVEALFPNEFIGQSRIDKLFRHGMPFVYGMLFRYVFSFTNEFMETVDDVRKHVDPDAYTIGVHARHSRLQDDGSDIYAQVSCLDHVLDHLRSQGQKSTKQRGCQLLMMSDREATISRLYEYAKNRGCAALAMQTPTNLVSGTGNISSSGDNRTLAVLDEHGPFEGAGFYQDILLLSKVRNGFVGTARSSSELVVELIAYETKIRQRHQGGISPPIGKYCIAGSCNCMDWSRG